ncbi:MAG: hypothetical protein QM718_06530 [Steroidobacteraceae bacterium]
MHATSQNLTGLRDGEPVAADMAQHVADCPACSQELARLAALRGDLQRLPALQPPAALWSRIDTTLTQPAAPRSRLQPAAALIACIVIALAAVWSGAHWPLRQLKPSLVNTAAAPIASLVDRSQQLEAILQALPQRPAVEHASTSAAIDALQGRIQLLDAQLAQVQQDNPSDSQGAQRLWQERVQLLNTLVSVRYAESARSGYRPATTGVI